MKDDHPVRIFFWSIIVSVAAVTVGFLYDGWEGAFLVLLLGVFEVSVSFDNAVVNARVLEKLSPFWQRVFLSLGLLIAVFGMRILFPLVVVGMATGLNPLQTWDLAVAGGSIDTPGTYAHVLQAAHPQIAAFGGIFLLTLALDFLFEERDIMWLKWLERPLAKIGKVDYAAIIVALVALLFISAEAHGNRAIVLVAGVTGLITYLLVSTLGSYFEKRVEEDDRRSDTKSALRLIGKGAFFSFLYLEVLDASFSFDGVIGALAITTDPIIIALGLGCIGAMFVRSITVYLVRKGTLDNYIYLDPGAHWAIGALAILLIISISTPIPEVVTGLVGIILIIAAFISSIIRNQKGESSSDDARPATLVNSQSEKRI